MLRRRCMGKSWSLGCRFLYVLSICLISYSLITNMAREVVCQPCCASLFFLHHQSKPEVQYKPASMTRASSLNQPCVGSTGTWIIAAHQQDLSFHWGIHRHRNPILILWIINFLAPTHMKNWNIYYGLSVLWWIKHMGLSELLLQCAQHCRELQK